MKRRGGAGSAAARGQAGRLPLATMRRLRPMARLRLSTVLPILEPAAPRVEAEATMAVLLVPPEREAHLQRVPDLARPPLIAADLDGRLADHGEDLALRQVTRGSVVRLGRPFSV